MFKGELSESQLEMLRAELAKWLRKEKDSCILFKGRNDLWMKKEFLTQKLDQTSQFL